jgi:hypothetical protein
MRLRLGEVISVLDRVAALAIADELGEVFAAAFEDGDAERFATDQLPTHADREDFKLVVARDENVVGFAYGFTGHRGQWWDGLDRGVPIDR